jgi:hypothetical protein
MDDGCAKQNQSTSTNNQYGQLSMEDLMQWIPQVILDLNLLEKNLEDLSNSKNSHQCILQTINAFNPVLKDSLHHVSQLKLDINNFSEDSKGTLGPLQASIDLSALM